jgi:hypothetical protein
MNDQLSTEDRRHVRTSLIATLALFFTLLIGTLDHLSASDKPFAEQVAWAGGSEAATEQATPATSAVPEAAGSSSAVETNEMVGCGCAEGCFTR